MTVAAIAAEYNPFHNGHAYQIAQTRKAGATHIAAIMSGNFTQRGTAAIAEKRARCRSALSGGVDLVVELPMPYAMATAQRFAFGVASIAKAMGCVDVLSFGSESGYISILQAAARAVDSPEVIERTRQLLKEGVTYARARQSAVSEICGDEVAYMLSSPNDLLAVEYIRQLVFLKSDILPFAVTRVGVGHDSEKAGREFASASFIRALVRSGGVQGASDFMPPEVMKSFSQAFEEFLAPIDERKLESMMLGVLRRLTPEEFLELPDLSEGLENRVYAAMRQACSVSELYALAKSKRYTAARIRRVVMSAFLGLYDELGAQSPPYIRVLGFNERGREILAMMKKSASLPVSDSLAYLRKQSEECAKFADFEARSTDMYLLGLPQIRPCGFDFTANSIRLI